MQTVSVRIPEDDLAWLAGLDLPDANSPSDKIRGLIAEARRRAAGEGDYLSCVAQMRDALRGFNDQLQTQEHALQIHSEALALLGAQLPELMAGVATALPAGAEASADSARQCEAQLTARAMRLLLGLLRLGVTRRAPAYDPALFDPYVSEVEELERLMQSARSAAPSAQ